MKPSCPVCASTDVAEAERNSLPLFSCAACGLLWRRTFDVPLSHYQAWDPESSGQKREARLKNCKERVRLLSRHMPLDGLCDVGTGEGMFLEVLKDAGHEGVGIEPSDIARAEAAAHGVRIVGRSIEDLPAAATTVPLRAVTLFHVIEHLPDPSRAAALIHAALPRGGYVVMETPDSDSPVLRRKGYRDGLIYPEHFFYFNRASLRRLLESAGFEIAAMGRRDFNDHEIPIGESLRRLGLLPLSPEAGTAEGTAPSAPAGGAPADSLLRRLVRRALSFLVRATGQLNFVWVVARKPL